VVSLQPTVVPKTSVSGDTPAILHEVKLTNLRPGTLYHYQVETGNARSRDYTFATHAASGAWRFIHTSNPNAYVQVKSKSTLASMTAMAPDFVVISGDVSNNATNNDYRRFFTRGRKLYAEKVVYTCQGNHDDRAWSTYDAWVHNDTSDAANERFYSFNIGPAHFVGINDAARPNVFPTAWFKQTLAQSRARWNIVFMNGNYRKQGWLKRLLRENRDYIDIILTSGSGNQFIGDKGVLEVQSGGSSMVYHVLDMTETVFRATMYTSDNTKKGTISIGPPDRNFPPPNQPPVARIIATPAMGEAPLAIRFDGLDSHDVEGPIAAYDWDFGDGNKGSGQSASHTYSEAGDYTVTLTVADEAGKTGVAKQTIYVTNTFAK
jgi:PKD repeat protein